MATMTISLKEPFILPPTNGRGAVSFQQSLNVYPAPKDISTKPSSQPFASSLLGPAHTLEETRKDEVPCASSLKSYPKEGRTFTICHFLAMPIEIRIQIYTHVLDSHPIRHAHLTPIPHSRNAHLHPAALAYLHQPMQAFPPKSRLLTSPPDPESPHGLPASKIPTSLLLTNRQIFEETRHLPFQVSEFVFVNWFWSGLFAARQFTRSLRDWQSDGLRFVGLEVGGSEIGDGGCADWRGLCGMWCGVRGMRLCIKGSCGGTEDSASGKGGVKSCDVRLSELDGRGEIGVEDGNGEVVAWAGMLLDVNAEWVREGLMKMGGLRSLDLEIQDGNVDQEIKREFCKRLEQIWGLSKQREKGMLVVSLHNGNA